jgi:hypothetical protein
MSATTPALSNFVSIMSFDVSAQIFHRKITSFLMPVAISQVFASDELLVLICVGLSDLPSPFEPETVLLAFSLSHTSALFSSLGYVPGSVHVSGEGDDIPVIIEIFTVGEEFFIRVATAQYNITEYHQYTDDAWQIPKLLHVSVLAVSDSGGSSMSVVGQINFA